MSASSLSVDIRPIANIVEAKQIEELQRSTWNRDDLEIIPGRLFLAMKNNGACLLGAFDRSKLVGFVFGVLGTVEDLNERIDQIAAARLLMYSMIMGVHPDYQRAGIGYRLKIAQREFALRIGVRLITWTFDPLESHNAYLNFQKLGVVCHKYLQDYYGEMGGINIGLPSDRFYVEWWVTSNRVKSRVSQNRGPLNLAQYLGGRAVIVNECEHDENNQPVPPDEFLQLDSSLILVEIPDDIQHLKSIDLPLSIRWRSHIRHVFDYYFNRQYLVTDFVRNVDQAGVNSSYYVLTQADG
ncbi:MAG TPA: hypothetical protein VFI27_12715 [candidate division Zixibacteria bacterium]|nr:hypothetical protein [candidate division Zixibacteria bacterium]